MQQQVTTIGLDLAKNLFQVHGADAQGRPVLKRRLAREKVLEFFANLPPCLVGLEACAAAPAGEATASGPPPIGQPQVPAPAWPRSSARAAAATALARLTWAS